MIDYTNNFPLPELRPEGGLLQFQAYTTTPAFQASWQGEGSILDRTRLTDPTAWGYEQDKRESISREEYYAATQLMAAEAGTNTGIYGEYIHSALGKDVNKGAVLRSIYFGADPLAAMPFGPSELPQTPEEEKELLDTLNTLTAAEVGLPVDSKNLTPNQKRIKELSDKLLYKKALEETDKNLGVSVSRQIFAQMELLSTLADKLGITDPEESAKLARDTKDIERIRTRIDPGFSPTEWFDRTYSDPIVQQGLLDNGITAQLIASARNQDEAEFRIYRALLQGDLQKRMATYSPTWTDNIRLAGASLVSGFVNSPDVVIDVGEIAGGVTLAVGGVLASPFTGGTSLTGTVGGAAMTATGTTNLFLKLKNIWQASKVLRGSYYAAETVLKLPMGFAPSYAKNLGLLGRTVTPTIMGFSGGALTEYARQQNEMAYAAATLYADPDAVKDYNMSEVAFAGIQSGIVGGALFGLAPNVIGSLAGATMNKLKGVNIAAPGEPVFRNTLDRRFTLKGTTIGDAIDYYGGLLDSKKKAVAVDGPLQETMAAKAELEKKNPTAEEVIKETETRVDRVETKNVETTDRAASIPETPALKRYENESKAGYVRRVAGLKEVSNIYQFVRELARKSPDAADNLRTSTDDWDKMTPMDKIRVLHDAGEHVKNLLDIETKLEGGLASGREKAIATLETQRKALIRNFSKGLTTDQVKALKKELKGEAVLELPKALAEARNSGATMASRKAAASDLAAKLVEKAEQAAKDKEQAAAVRNSVPQDLLDSFDEMSTEAGLKGAVSEETVQNIKANLVGERVAEPAIQDKFKAAIKKAMLIKRIDEARMEKIRAVINSPHKFVDIVTGNKNNAKRFYENLLKLNNAGLVSKEDMELVLAAVVHLNFDNKAFAIEYAVAPITDKDGKVLDRVAGEFKPSANKLTINSKFRAIGPSEASTLAMTVLHELGHAFFYHSVKGDAYMDVLKLYNNANSDRFFMTDIRGSDDSLLASGFLDAYHHTNAEETFVETFSKILFTEAEFAVANLDPIKVSMTQLMMDRIMESIALAANMWDSSSHYKAASKIIDKITQVNKLLDDGVSVSKYVTAMQTMLTSGAAQNLTQANRVLETELKTNKYNFTKDELDTVNKIGYTDPAFFVAFAINKSQGRSLKTQADFDYVTRAYSRYKATQFSSLLFRVTYGLSLNAKVLKTMTKEQRLAFFELNFFDGLNKSMGVGALSSPARLPTYEDMALGRLIGNLDETYNATYWLTDGLEYRAVLEEKGLDTTLFDSFDNLKISVLEQLKTFLNEAGLEDMADIAITATQKNFLRKLQKEGIFSLKEITDVTSTPAFKTWFGKSKIVDKNGKPLIVYHGSSDSEPISIFKLDKHVDRDSARKAGWVSYLGRVFYFSKNAKDASDFALYERSGENASVYPVYLRIEKPFDTSVEFSHKDAKKLLVDFYEQLLKETPDNKTLETQLSFLKVTLLESTLGKDIYKQMADIGGHADKANAYLQTLGYDGIIDSSSDMGIQYAVFKPEQIKSIWNDGTFSRTNPDIRRNIKPPIWSSIESAKTAIAQIISDYKNLKTPDLDVGGLIGILAEQIEPNLFAKFLQDEAAQIIKLSPEESVINLLGTVYNAIDKGTLVFNNKTNKWESAKPKKKRKTPAKKEKPVITPEQSKLEAAASNSPEVTPDNYKEHVLALTDLYNKTKSLKALRVLSRIIDGSATEIIGEIENGTINTLEKLRQRIEKAGRNVLVDEGRQYRRVKGPDGKIQKVLVESVQAEAGDVKEGIVAGRLEKIDIEGLEKENKKTLIDRIRPLINSVLDDFFTKEENDLIEAFKAGDYTNEGAGKILGVSGETARLRYNAFKKRLESLMVEADLDAKALADPIMRQEQLLAWKKRQDSTVAESKKGKPSSKKIASTLKESVSAPSESTVKTGERILAVQAKINKADTTRGTSEEVSVPTNTITSAMARVTTSLTNNEAEPVLRPNDQADNLLAGETTATKEAVVFTPKNPLKVVYNNFSELEVAPEKLKKLTELAKKTGYDSLVFRDGSVLPLEETKTVGVVEINTPVGLNTVVTVTKEKGVPVKKITNVEKPPTTHPGDGAPVTLNKNGEPKRAAPEQKKSDLVEETEAANLERKINEDREALRASGLDTNSLKKFLSFYWKRMKEIDKEGGAYTTLFKKMWNKFVVINSEIYEANLKLVGEDGIKAFWKKVDDLRAQDKHKLATVPGYKTRTDASVFAEAARLVNENFIPFITPNELTIKKVGDDYVFSSNVKRVKSIVAANKEEPPVPTPPVIEKPAETAEVKEVKLPEQDKDEAMERETLLEQGINKADQASSTPLRLTNLIGIIFGGSNRESANWWRRLMNWARNSSQAASQTGKTIQSLQRKVRFVSRLFDDTRAQTGHLVAAGKSAFRTAMQCASDEGRIIARISKYQMRLYRNLNNMPDQRRNLMLTVWRRLSEGADISAADVRAAGIPSSMVNQTVSQANDLLVIVRQVNRQLLELEAETGLVNTVDAMGNPVDPQRWATVQLDHEKLSRLSPQERALLIDRLVSARINRKLSNEMLDINTLIVLGWLDVAPSRQNRGTALLAGNREFRAGTAINSFDRATLANLDTGIVYPIGIDPQRILADLANRGQPNRFFVLESNNTLKVYELPRRVSQLSDADRAKYFNAIRGDTSVYTPRWRDYITRSGARNLVELEMKETLDFKTKRGRYSKFNSEMSSNLDRPLMPIGTDEETSLAVPGLIPEEVLAFKEITDVMRTNLAESYFHFLKGRMFALLFQRELDRLLGTTGITIIDVLDYVRRSSEEDLKNLQRSEGWTSQQFEQRLNELNIGMSRIREEYASHADTLPVLFNPEMYASRASMAYLKMKVAVGYGISALPETIMEYIKTNPLRIPGEIIKSLRYVLGDLRFSKSALLEEDSGTLLYMLENFRHEHSSRFLGEVAHGSFELDSKLRTKFINSTQSLGAADTGVRGLEVGARVAESIGSLQAITNFVRGMGVRRWQARIWKHISKGRIQKLLTALEDPNMAQLMERIYRAAETDPVEERKLWKQFAAEARKAGFGFDPHEAMVFMRYGLNTKEKIRHLEYLIRQAGGTRRGLVNIDRMADVYWRHRNNPQQGIDNRLLEEVLSSYAFMLNDIVIRTTSPEPVGLGRITNIEAKTQFGRLWYALTSWIRGFQDSVILNYATTSTLKFVASNIILLGTVDTLIGMFKEWIAGRETEDILNEYEENPEAFAIRVMRAAPIMGILNGYLELALSGINSLSGGTWRSYNNPMSSIGIGAASSATRDIMTGVADASSQITGLLTGEEEFEPAKLAAAGGKILPYNSLFNRSPIAVPARFVEDMGYLDQRGAVQQYLDLIQREPYPYAKSKRRATRGSDVLTMPPAPRNIAKEMAEYKQLETERPKINEGLKEVIKQQVVNDQKGVSGKLGELLK